MTLLGGALLLAATPIGLWLLGAELARRLPASRPAERLAWAVLGGLGVLLLILAVVNAFVPLRGWTAWLCLAPTLLASRPTVLRAGLRDIRTLFSGRGLALVAGTGLFLLLLLWPRLTHPDVLYYDGTANHDGFFWITGAQNLQQSSYLEERRIDRAHPALNTAQAMSGWLPSWGRMAGEGYLALLSSLTGASPLSLYLFASAALLFPWVAAVFLFVRMFITERLRAPALFALGALEPLFAFTHHNGNLPNLLGVLCGAIAVAAVARSLGRTGDPTAWSERLLAALGVHGLLCSYPELAPFVALPLVLLLVRGGLTGRALTPLAGALLAGAVVWPVTTWRALQGFGVSFLSARAGDHWANLFSTIAPAQFLPAIMTLSPKTGTELGALGGGLVTAVLVATGTWTIFRARDRTGLLLTLSGAAALALYTATTDFSYGWQKTMQFAAVSLSAVLPAGGIALAVAETRGWRQIAAAGVAAFFVFAQAIIELDLLKWSERKALAADWLQLDATVRARGATCVAIDPRTFSQPFFHAMWAPYFLGRVPATLFVERGAGTGGYLRASIVSVPADAAPGASLVGRAWADTLDANSPRLLAGRDFALLDRVNRLLASSGLQPSVGVPQRAAPVFSLTVLPHAAAELQVEIVRDGSAGIWEVANDLRVGGQSAVSEPGRWTLRVRLVGGRTQTIAFRFVPAAASPTPPTFELRRVAIQ